jgi:rhamnose utilization protein RhaD (predicted bifunctional aldolase and dehydrogenase)/NAD(P)-dependent dehydrogenase (short-subunit alcohol dehydrogenase family)
MKQEINDLIAVSRYYGSNKDYVIAGGGNTSFKDEETIWIKASGQSLAELTEDGLVALDRVKLRIISTNKYSDDPVEREEQVKQDLMASVHEKDKSKRPSVETSLHELIRYRFVVHLHPTVINGLLCSRTAKNNITRLFGDSVLFVPYIDPGYTLFKKLESAIASYRDKNSIDPKIILLENHGSFVAADTTAEIKNIYDDIIGKISAAVPSVKEIKDLPYNPVMNRVIPVLRMALSSDASGKPIAVRSRNNSLIAEYTHNQQEYHKISLPLTPDIIVYCKAMYMYIDQTATPERIIDSFRYQLPHFLNEFGFPPRIIVMKDMGVFAFAENIPSAECALDVYEDLIRISHYATQWGGIKFLTPEQVSFIDKWEVENYRRKVASAASGESKLINRIAIVTGGAQGFGAGIAEALFEKKMNVVIADVNEETGNAFAAKLTTPRSMNRAIFVKTDVSDPESVKNLISSTVKAFGGLDLMVSNAGILRAGSLDEMDPETFSKSTDVNYKGYFLCAKFSSEIMKLQNPGKPGYFTDIIQINSKSGLRGSNRNFAYAGAKFGGIGLTQSFALELAPYNIKVNAICPGNFYEGPLWSDPKNGLFVQYLKTGKVPGAKTIDDIRKFYEEQVPMKRGCRLEDVVKALLYIIDQEYETGQAFPVTGGQVMLG